VVIESIHCVGAAAAWMRHGRMREMMVVKGSTKGILGGERANLVTTSWGYETCKRVLQFNALVLEKAREREWGQVRGRKAARRLKGRIKKLCLFYRQARETLS
jgi:hypothetical protein